MSRYVFQKFEKQGTESEFEVDGEIVETYNDRPYNSSFVALVEVEDTGETEYNEKTVKTVSEGVEEPTCSGKDGSCSRTVEKSGDTCWQHE